MEAQQNMILLYSNHSNNENNNNNSDGFLAKTVAMFTLFTSSMIMGTLPLLLSRILHNWQTSSRQEVCTQLLLCFGGGVLLCTTFIHLLPEVSEKTSELKVSANLPECLMCIGFFLMYFIEEVVHMYLARRRDATDLHVTTSTTVSTSQEKFENTIVEYCAESGGHHTHHLANNHGPSNDGRNAALKVFRGLLVVLALSIHGLFEGLAVGLESTTSSVWYLFGAVSAHKLVIAFCIGVELVATEMRPGLVLIYVFTFAVVSPLGIGSGMVVAWSRHNGYLASELPAFVLQSLAAGTLLYVVFFEILASDKRQGLAQYFSVLMGFLIMFGITFLG